MSSHLLKFQIGPVQDFIAQARSTRDLWSGSYLLSWLVASGIEKAGRLIASCDDGLSAYSAACEALVYPALQGQPLIEQRFKTGSLPAEKLGFVETCNLLTPNIPNIFVLQMSGELKQVASHAREIEEAIHAEWRAISKRCQAACETDGIVSADSLMHFNHQSDRLLAVAWQIVAFGGISYNESYAALTRRLDAVRQCREFRAWREGRWHREAGTMTEKDTLTGKEEAIIGGSEWFETTRAATAHWDEEKNKRKGLWNILLREKHAGDYLGAVTLVKRTWHWHFLHDKHKFQSLHTKEQSTKRTQFPFPSTRHVARHQPWSNLDEESDSDERSKDRIDGYFAVLAFDGDSIGKWVSGAFCPLDADWHRDFSRRLSCFALKWVRPIVDACDGRLIYAGGDDVLALLPPDTALDCARFLRMAYRGDFGFIPQISTLAESLIARNPSPFDQDECVKLREADFSPHRLNARDKVGIFADPTPVDARHLPGGVTGRYLDADISPDASVGIAIAHFKNPLQDVIRSAQLAEKRAKRDLSEGGLGRSAFSVSLLKRSGEHIDWGCQWESGGIELYDLLARAQQSGHLSSRFPYRLVEVLAVYQCESKFDALEFDAAPVIKAEFAHVLARQSTDAFKKGSGCAEIVKALGIFLGHLSAKKGTKDGIAPQKANQFLLSSVVGLCQTLAFTIRDGALSDAASPSQFEPITTVSA